MDPQTAANLEVLRARAMGGPPSGAGIPGGSPAINTPSQLNPVATGGAAQPPTPAPQQGMAGAGGGGNPFAAGMSALQKAQPDEATIIVKGLLSRLGNLPSGGMQVGGLNG